MQVQRATRRIIRSLVASFISGSILAGVTLVAATPAHALTQGADDYLLLTLTNQARAAAGVAPLSLASDLTAVASQWAQVMASQGGISHNPDLPNQLSGWRMVAENVGVGGTIEAIHQGFLNSPSHYRNVVDPSLSQVGFGFVWLSDRVYVVENFKQPSAASRTSTSSSTSTSSTPASILSPVPAPPPTAPPTTRAIVPASSSTTTPTTAVPDEPVITPAGITTPISLDPTPWMVITFETLRELEPVLGESS